MPALVHLLAKQATLKACRGVLDACRVLTQLGIHDEFALEQRDDLLLERRSVERAEARTARVRRVIHRAERHGNRRWQLKRAERTSA